MKDQNLECRVALFRIEDLSFGGHRFKIDKTARNSALNGVIYFNQCCLIMDKKMNPDLFSLVVVEGGPKAIK